MTKKSFYDKAMNLVRSHGEITIHFKQWDCQDSITFMRKRKIRADGKCFVSYLDTNNRWTRYHMSCFMCDVRCTSVEDTIKRIRKHDGSRIQPLLLQYGKGKDKRRIEL